MDRSGEHMPRSRTLNTNLRRSHDTIKRLIGSVFPNTTQAEFDKRYKDYWFGLLDITDDDLLFSDKSISNKYKFAGCFNYVSTLISGSSSKTIQKRQVHLEPVKWVSEFLTQFEKETSHLTTVTTSEYTVSVNRLLELIGINNENIFYHGSYAVHLLNPEIKYQDIDFFSSMSSKICIGICVIIYLMSGKTMVCEKIPYVKNLLTVFEQKTRDTNIMDALHMDTECIEYLRQQKFIIRYGNVSIMSPVAIFFNYFKMLPLQDRREKVRNKKTRQKLILETLWSHVGAVADPGLLVLSYEFFPSFITLTVNNQKYNFYNKLRDEEFTANFITPESVKPKTYRHYRQFSSTLSEQFVYNHSTAEYHINYSRNEVYIVRPKSANASDLVLHPISLLAMMSTLATFDFITKSLRLYNRIITYLASHASQELYTGEMVLYNPRTKNSGRHMYCIVTGKYVYISVDEERSLYVDK